MIQRVIEISNFRTIEISRFRFFLKEKFGGGLLVVGEGGF